MLVFEYAQGVVLRSGKSRSCGTSRAAASARGAGAQMLMGEGKTTMICPRGFIQNQETLVVQVVPQSLLSFPAGASVVPSPRRAPLGCDARA